MLTECAHCGFYVLADEDFCPDCGVSAPARKLETNFDEMQRSSTITFAALLAFVFAFAVLYGRSDGKFDNLWDLPIILVFGFFAGIIILLPIGMMVTNRSEKTQTAERFPPRELNTTLDDIGATIVMRRYELENQRRDVENLIDAADRKGSAAVKERLLAVRESVQTQIARYELERCKLDLIYLQNDLLPIVCERNLTGAEKEISIGKIKGTLSEISLLRQSLTNSHAVEFTEATQAERENLLARLDETKAVWEKLRASLLNDESAFTATFTESSAMRRTDFAGFQMSPRDFSASFRSLDRAFENFQAQRKSEEEFYR